MELKEIALCLFAIVGMAYATAWWLVLIHKVETVDTRKIKRAMKRVMVRFLKRIVKLYEVGLKG